MSIKIQVDIAKVTLLRGLFGEAIDLAIRKAALRIKDELQSITPVDKGGLRGSFRAIPTGTGVIMRWGTSYASYPDAGTPPHEIYPKTKKALKFNIGGRTIFAKMVFHPGQPPQNYTTLTLMAAREIIKEELSKAMIQLTPMVS